MSQQPFNPDQQPDQNTRNGNQPYQPPSQSSQPYGLPQTGYSQYPTQPIQQNYSPPQPQQQYPQIQPLPAGWQPPIQPGQWSPTGGYGGVVGEPAGNLALYLLPGAGALLLVLSTYLPWLTINIFGADFTVNGLGGITAPPGFLENISRLSSASGSTNSATSSSATSYFWLNDGWPLLVLAALTLILAFVGIVQKSKFFAAGTLISGIIACGLVGYDFFRISGRVVEYNSSVVGGFYPSVTGIAQTGFGLYLGVLSALVIAIGSIITFWLFSFGTVHPPVPAYGQDITRRVELPAWAWIISGVAVASVVGIGIFTVVSAKNFSTQPASGANAVPTASGNSVANINATVTAFAATINANLTVIAATKTSTPSTTPIPSPTRAIPTPTMVPQPVKGKIGETLSSNGYIITVNQTEKSTTYGRNGKAKDGYIFLAVHITVQSDKDKDVFADSFYTSLTDGQGNKYLRSFSEKEPALKSQSNLPIGEKVRGWVTFEVPVTANGFTFEYQLAFVKNNPNIISFILE